MFSLTFGETGNKQQVFVNGILEVIKPIKKKAKFHKQN